MSTVTITKRNEVRKRAKGRCEYCRTSERITGYALEIDHIIPESQGGSSEMDNLCLACRRCNSYKSDHILLISKRDSWCHSLVLAQIFGMSTLLGAMMAPPYLVKLPLGGLLSLYSKSMTR